MFIKRGTIILRAVEEGDMEFCRQMINSEYIEHLTTSRSFPVSARDQENWFRQQNRNDEIRFIIDAQDGPVGIIQITSVDWINRNGELGIKFHPHRERTREQTMDACTAFLDYLFFELNMHGVYAYVMSGNLFSVKLLQRFGFSRDGVLRQRIYRHGVYLDLLAYSLMKAEYKQTKSGVPEERNCCE